MHFIERFFKPAAVDPKHEFAAEGGCVCDAIDRVRTLLNLPVGQLPFLPETVGKVLACARVSRRRMYELRTRGLVTEKFYPSRFEDVLLIGILLNDFVRTGILPPIRQILDLGGNGISTSAFSMCGYTATLIEMDQTLIGEASRNIRYICRNEAFLNPQIVHGRFSEVPGENSTQVQEALSGADVIYCYPFTFEVKMVLKMLSSCCRSGSLVVFYQNAFDLEADDYSWIVTADHERLFPSLGIRKLLPGITYPSPYLFCEPQIGNLPTLSHAYEWAIYMKI